MDFVCTGTDQNRHGPFIIASSPGNYRDFPEMKRLRQQIRESRIGQDEVNAARNWLQGLQRFEVDLINVYESRGVAAGDAILKARTEIAYGEAPGTYRYRYRDLGTHFGQAFNGNYEQELCCYKCQAMFGFRTARVEARTSQPFINTMTQFDWASVNPVACAEFMVALICVI